MVPGLIRLYKTRHSQNIAHQSWEGNFSLVSETPGMLKHSERQETVNTHPTRRIRTWSGCGCGKGQGDRRKKDNSVLIAL